MTEDIPQSMILALKGVVAELIDHRIELLQKQIRETQKGMIQGEQVEETLRINQQVNEKLEVLVKTTLSNTLELRDLKDDMKKLQEWKDRELEARANRIATALAGVFKNPMILLRISLYIAALWLATSGAWSWIGHALHGALSGGSQ
jgi:hypothetical protein